MNVNLFLNILLIKALAMILFILYGGIGLGPDEAQYWTWSRMLDWGYYSKPPAIAWQIWLGTSLFGHTELGVRIGSVLIGTLLPIAVYFLARKAELTMAEACWAGLMMALTPLGVLSSFLAITDGGMVLFWTLACLTLFPENHSKPNDLRLGLLIALGALFKWTMFYFWLVRLIWRWKQKPILRSSLLFGVLISLAGLIPSVIWNMQHDWPTFKHVFYTIHEQEQVRVSSGGNFLQFLGAQIGLLSPLIFLLFAFSHYTLWKEHSAAATSGKVASGTMLSFLGLSLFKRLQGNWCDFAYPSAFPWIIKYVYDRFKNASAILTISIASSVALMLFFFFLPLPFKMNPFKQNIGWSKLSQVLSASGYNPRTDFLFGDKYQTASLLSFYGPAQKRAYFFNVHGVRNNQFTYWPGMESEQIGNTGYFVAFEGEAENYKTLLKPYFKEVELVGIEPLVIQNGKSVKSAIILKAIDYQGKKPPEVLLY